jgi:hypothetical protein
MQVITPSASYVIWRPVIIGVSLMMGGGLAGGMVANVLFGRLGKRTYNKVLHWSVVAGVLVGLWIALTVV